MQNTYETLSQGAKNVVEMMAEGALFMERNTHLEKVFDGMMRTGTPLQIMGMFSYVMASLIEQVFEDENTDGLISESLDILMTFHDTTMVNIENFRKEKTNKTNA